jgi:predicted transcriptional regulator
MRIAQNSTSVNAFHDHIETGKAHAQRSRILEFIKERGGDWSIGEIAKALKLEKSTVSARINELLHETHELAAKLHRKDRISSITIRPVGLPVAQLDMFQ